MKSIVPQRLILVQRQPDVVDRFIIQCGPKQRTVSRLPCLVGRGDRSVQRMRRDAWVWLAERIVAIGAPSIVCRVVHHGSTNGIGFMSRRQANR